METNLVVLGLGILLVIGGLATAIFANKDKLSNKKSIVLALILFGALLFVGGNSFVIIPTGSTGVKATFGQIDKTTLQAGMHFKAPFIQTVNTVNNKQQDIAFQNQIWGESSEKTVVYAAQVTFTYQINPEKSAWIYANVTNYQSGLVPQELVNSSIKAAMVELNTTEVTQRGKIEPLAKEKIQASLNEKYGENVVVAIKIVINDMDFEDSYNAAIAERQIAQQTYEKQVIENKKAIEKAEADKQVAVLNAQATAESTLISAKAEAEANKILTEQLTDAILEDKWISKWDGKLPEIVGTDTVIPVLDSLNDKAE